MPSILAGDNVLVCSATASGKTETACAPLVERNMGRWQRWTVLYISPTRALVNDLYERLHSPLDSLGLKVVRRTGDHRDPLGQIPNFLLTTPESFDSLMCRGATSDGRHVLANVVAVVLDEIHLLHGTARGEQVRWLLARLRKLREYGTAQGWTKNAHVQVVALSATVPSPDMVRDAYLENGKTILVSGSRTIQDVGENKPFGEVEFTLQAYLRSAPAKEKILVFTNKRKRVDTLATSMKPILAQLGYDVYGHHGSLATAEREKAETAAKRFPAVVVFATSTLEIGIDIGDIDLVVLDGPPPNIPALLQRIGRGKRRTDTTRVLACGSSKAEETTQRAMLAAARESWLGPAETSANYAVARQQVASYIFQSPKRKRTRAAIVDVATRAGSAGIIEAMLDHMLHGEELTNDAGYLRLGDEWNDATAAGEIHSNIEGTAGHTVIDYDTGDPIAKGIRYQSGKGMAIAGSELAIRRIDRNKLEARRGLDSTADPAKWSYHSRGMLQDGGQGQAVKRLLAIPATVWPMVSVGSRCAVFHFGGSRTRALLELLAKKRKDQSVKTIDAWMILFAGRSAAKPTWMTSTGPAIVRLLAQDDLARIEKTLARPRSNASLPQSLRLQEVLEWLDVTERLKTFESVEFLAASPEQAEILSEFV